MTLDEAIKHCEEIAMDKTNLAQTLWDSKEKARCKECADEHEQLAQWLIELKILRNNDVLDKIRAEVEQYKISNHALITVKTALAIIDKYRKGAIRNDTNK